MAKRLVKLYRPLAKLASWSLISDDSKDAFGTVNNGSNITNLHSKRFGKATQWNDDERHAVGVDTGLASQRITQGSLSLIRLPGCLLGVRRAIGIKSHFAVVKNSASFEL